MLKRTKFQLLKCNMTNYQISTQDTYIHLVKENLSLIKRLLAVPKKKVIAFNPNDTSSFYKSRARHLQVMSLLGLTTEHLLKLIILNRGYSVFEVDHIKINNNLPEIKYTSKTISFDKAASLFKNSNTEDYFKDIKTYEFNLHDTDYEYSYLGHKRIEPRICITLLQKIRNNYIHKADSHGEWNGIIWYIYNFVIWLSNKEFPSHFSKYKYIGNFEIQGLFRKNKV